MDTQGISRRKGTENDGIKYEQNVIALLAVKCALSDDVQDMWIATNVDGLGAFDDLVFHIERSEGKCIRREMYLIQVKHRKNKMLYISSGENHLINYQEDFKKIKEDFNTSPLKNNCHFEDIKFLLFTNTKINTTKMQTENITLCPYQNDSDFINTGKMFQISQSPQNSYDPDFLKQTFFYTQQVDVSKIENVLKSETNKYFKDFNVDAITKFFENWHSKKFENKEVLKKYDIQSIILKTVLSNYIPKRITTKFPKADLWNEVVNQFQFTFVKDDNHLAKLWQGVELQMRTFFNDQTIDLLKWNESLQEVANKIGKIKQHFQDDEFPIRKNKYSYVMKDLYLFLWQFGEVPLILNLEADDNSEENIHISLSKLESSKSKRRYIFLGKTSNYFLRYSTHFNILNINRNIKEKVLKNTSLSLQNKEVVALEKLKLSNEALEKITPDVLIELLQTVTNEVKDKERYLPRFIRQPTLSTGVLSIRDAVFVIVVDNIPNNYISLLSKFHQPLPWYLYKLCSKQFSHKFKIPNCCPENVTCIILHSYIENLKNFIYIENIIKEIRRREDQTIHYFQYINEKKLKWLYSNKDTDHIKPFLISNSEEYLSDSVLFHSITFNILSGNAGEGKSILLEVIANNCPADVWVIKLSMGDIAEYIEQGDFSTIKTFLYNQSNENFNSYNEFSWELFQSLYEERNMLVIIDGVDEIAYNSKIKRFLSAVKSLGVKTLIAVRPSLKDSLEKQLNVLSLFLKPLTDDDCRSLLKLTLRNNYDNINDTDISEFLKQISSWNNILGVPLLLKLYVSLLSNENGLDISKLDLSDLFGRYIEEQLKRVCTYNASTMRTLSRSALFVLYNKNVLSELFTIKEYLEDMEDKIQIYTKSKLIEKLNNNVPIFAHKSLAEFLTAKYLSDLAKESTNNVPSNFLKSLFYKELEMVRFFFDIMILKDSELQNIITASNHIYTCNEINHSVDRFGRNGMHIAASYGNRRELRITQSLWPGVKIYETYNNIIFNGVIDPCQDSDKKIVVPVNIISKLLQEGLDPFKKDDLYKMDAFDFAIESGSLEVIELLFSKNLVKPLENINQDILVYTVVKNGYINIFRQFKTKNLNLKILPALDNLLHVALTGEKFDIISELTNSITSIDEANIFGYSPLINWLSSSKAISSRQYLFSKSMTRDTQLNENQLDILYHIIDKGGNLNNVNGLGETPLHAFCSSQAKPVVKKVIQYGAKVNMKTKLGDTSLHYASRYSLENVKLLLKYNCHIDIPNYFGYTPLCFAAQCNQPDVLKYLIKKGANVNGHKGISPLNVAVLNGHANCAKLLIKFHAKINNDETNNTLGLAVFSGHLNCVKLLITNKAKIHRNLFHLAISHNHKDIIEFLFTKFGTFIESENKKSLLSRAVETNDADIIDILISFGMDINTKLENGYAVLHHASILGLVNIVKRLIKHSCEVNVESNDGVTPLTLAALFNHLQILKILIDNGSDLRKYGPDAIIAAVKEGYNDIVNYVVSAGADINGTDLKGYAPIHYASAANLNYVKTLIYWGANVNLKTFDNSMTPLMTAAINGFRDILEYLVENKAKLDELNKNCHTALIMASQGGHLECVKYLIDKGSNVERYGSSAICFAVIRHHIAVADYLISLGANINGTVTNDVYAPIHIAVFKNDLKAVKYLLNKGANIDSKILDNGYTPLMIAAMKGFKHILKCLVKKKAKLDELNKNCHTALTVASSEGHLECVKYLINKGSNVDTYGSSAICFAVLMDHIAVADYLISVGVDINGTTIDDGHAPIHIAVFEGSLKAVENLLNKGANINLKTLDNGNTPLMIAAFKGFKHILEYLVEKEARLDELNKNCNTALTMASHKGYLECVKYLIDKGSNVKRYGSSAICFAVVMDHIAVADYLISVGVDINGTAIHDGRAPIHIAVSKDNLKAVEYMLDKGANINLKTLDNRITPLMTAAFKGFKDILGYLVENKAKLNETDKNGQTALIMASQAGHLECVKLLVEKGSDTHKYGLFAIYIAAVQRHTAIVDYLVSIAYGSP